MLFVTYNNFISKPLNIRFIEQRIQIMILNVENLHKAFNKKTVLNNLSYRFEKGKIYGILGRNGAGKTTLFNCIIRELSIDEGKISLIENKQERELTFEDTGMVSASPVLPEFLTGYEFITYFLQFNQGNQVANEQKVIEYFNLFNIEESDQHKLIKNYSYGMKNKLQLLCCFIRNPEIILLDEPLSSFDIIVSHDIKERLIQMKQDHIILMSTHILQLATDVCDEILLLKNGQLTGFDWRNDNQEENEKYLIEALKSES